ncbi:META domain-containing protein [Helicobacter sp. T3_23-1056]
MKNHLNPAKYICKIYILVFLLAFLCVASADAFQGILGTNAYSLASQKKWEVDSMMVGDYEIVVPNHIPNAYLNFSGGSVSGVVGCNHFFASYQIAGGGKMIIIEGGGLTKKSCASAQEEQLEAIFIKNFIGKFMVRGNDEYIELLGESSFSIRLFPSITL